MESYSKVYKISGFYQVLTINGACHTIAKIEPLSGVSNVQYFARFKDKFNNVRDYLPGGSLFLNSDLDEAVKKIEDEDARYKTETL